MFDRKVAWMDKGEMTPSTTTWPQTGTIRFAALLLLLVTLLTCLAPPLALADDAPAAVTPDTKLLAALDNLATIQQSIETRRGDIRALREQARKLGDTSERQEIEQEIERTRGEIAELQQSFEQVILSGINLSALADEPEQQINWREEIEQISLPLLSTLKELTAKPRRIDNLNRDIERRERQLKVIDKALESISTFSVQELPASAAEQLKELQASWEQRRDDTQRALDISRLKLESARAKDISWRTAMWDALVEFCQGRGLTLLIAIGINLVILLLARGMRSIYLNRLYRSPRISGITRAPLVLYSYRLAMMVFMVLATLMVFYIRGDLLLLTLALIALVGTALALRQTLPRFAAEIRLLLGVGPVREDERLVLEGVPFQVESLGVFAVLKNPDLEGVVRLPLHRMNSLASRPAGPEPWYPCQSGDFVLLPEGRVGKVLRQTIELVELSVLDSKILYRTGDFLGLNIRNLSRDGFGVSATFGIDYRHQAICLDTVPDRFRVAIRERFRQAGLGDNVLDILVEFKTAGASSLDYQIYVVLDGRAASSYYKAQRLVQQACVDTCNREGWIIPFTQITVHSE